MPLAYLLPRDQTIYDIPNRIMWVTIHACSIPMTSLMVSWRIKKRNLDILRLILGLRPANERQRYFVTTSLIGWPQAFNQPCICSGCVGYFQYNMTLDESMYICWIMYLYSCLLQCKLALHSLWMFLLLFISNKFWLWIPLCGVLDKLAIWLHKPHGGH